MKYKKSHTSYILFSKSQLCSEETVEMGGISVSMQWIHTGNILYKKKSLLRINLSVLHKIVSAVLQSMKTN